MSNLNFVLTYVESTYSIPSHQMAMLLAEYGLEQNAVQSPAVALGECYKTIWNLHQDLVEANQALGDLRHRIVSVREGMEEMLELTEDLQPENVH